MMVTTMNRNTSAELMAGRELNELSMRELCGPAAAPVEPAPVAPPVEPKPSTEPSEPARRSDVQPGGFPDPATKPCTQPDESTCPAP